jgi:hypothetical protein
MLRSRNSSPLAGKVRSRSLHSFPGISVPGRLNPGLEVGTLSQAAELNKEEE